MVAKKILEHANLDEKRRPSGLPVEAIQSLLAAFMAVKIQSPPVDCLSPIEDLLIKKGLEKAIDSRYAATVTRNPSVSQGNPFQVEVGLVFGGIYHLMGRGVASIRKSGAFDVSTRWLLADQSN